MIWTSGDTKPLDITLTRGGAPIDLTGASIEFHMTPRYGGVGSINAAASILGTPALGRVRYEWGAGETEVEGVFNVEWQVTDASGAVETFPPSADVIEFHADLAD